MSTAEPTAAPTPTVRPPLAVTSAETDRDALVAFYNATGGEGWALSGAWLSTAPMGEWYGVETDEAGRVTELDLHGNRLRGEIPPELGDLANLERLWLRDNQLSGEIPPELGNLTGLTVLLLGENQLSGCVPQSLEDTKNLTWAICRSAASEPLAGRWMTTVGSSMRGRVRDINRSATRSGRAPRHSLTAGAVAALARGSRRGARNGIAKAANAPNG